MVAVFAVRLLYLVLVRDANDVNLMAVVELKCDKKPVALSDSVVESQLYKTDFGVLVFIGMVDLFYLAAMIMVTRVWHG